MLPAQYVYAKKMCPAQVKPASVFKRDHASVLSSQPSGDIVQGGTPSQIQVPCDTKKYSLLQSEPALEVPGHAEAGYRKENGSGSCRRTTDSRSRRSGLVHRPTKSGVVTDRFGAKPILDRSHGRRGA
jgi:hypothetical protein